MTSIDDDRLIDFVLGMTDDDEQAAVESLIVGSSDVRDRVAQLRDTLALPALVLEPIFPSDNLGSRIRDSIEHPDRFGGFIDRLSAFLDLPEDSVRKLVSEIATAEPRWPPSGLPDGTLMYRFDGGPRHRDAECALVWMKPEAVFPPHTHIGDEWGFVLQGEAVEDSGQVLRSGELVHRDAKSTHHFTAIGGEPFVFAVIHEGVVFS